MQKKSVPAVLFAGPSLNENIRYLAVQQQVQILPPVKRMDIPNLIKTGFKGVILIADGVFYESVTVGHVEIRKAIEDGFSVWGLSSMGAIRAFEMRSLGMKGYGKVYEWFLSEEDFMDDEVALLHSSEPPYLAISEPLVHIRQCLKEIQVQGLISESHAQEIISKLKELYFGDRSLALFKKLLTNRYLGDPDELMQNFNRYRIKSLDLERFLIDQVWATAL